MAYAITDIEAADKFVQDHSEDARYVEAWDKWVVWRGDRWVVRAKGGHQFQSRKYRQKIRA